jgi:DNA-directed RNA polymerase subunit RPC12/RpoP
MDLGNFKNVRVEHAELSFSAFNHPIEYRCNWCSGPAYFLVSRTSVLTDKQYADYACTVCAHKWITPTREQRSQYGKYRVANMPAGLREQWIERLSENKKEFFRRNPECRHDATCEARANRWGCQVKKNEETIKETGSSAVCDSVRSDP